MRPPFLFCRDRGELFHHLLLQASCLPPLSSQGIPASKFSNILPIFALEPTCEHMDCDGIHVVPFKLFAKKRRHRLCILLNRAPQLVVCQLRTFHSCPRRSLRSRASALTTFP